MNLLLRVFKWFLQTQNHDCCVLEFTNLIEQHLNIFYSEK